MHGCPHKNNRIMATQTTDFDGRQTNCRPSLSPAKKTDFRVHPLFLLVGVWYAFTGELFLFLISAVVALQHELAHAFAAAKLGYKLNAIVLMPFGAVIDGELDGISLKDEISVAVWGPLCNLITAAFFVAVWWFAPTVYAFTDTAFQASLSIALVNFLPAYPLDGGRILRCALTQAFAKTHTDAAEAAKKAETLCRIVSVGISLALLVLFAVLAFRGSPNFSLLAFGCFLLVSAFGNKDKSATYARMDFSVADVLARGAEIRRVAVVDTLPVKDVVKFLSKEYYLVLEVYDLQEEFSFSLSQNQFAALFLRASSPYQPLRDLSAFLGKSAEKAEKTANFS